MRGSYILGPAYLPTASGPGLAAWIIDGNTNGSEKYIGTNDNYDFPIRTNGIEKLCVGTAGQIFRGSGSRNLFSIAFSTSNTSWGYLAGNAGVSGVNNTLIGGNAGLLLTTGTSNTAVGYNAGQALVSAVQNTFIGNSSGFNVTGDKNTALGYTSLSSQTSGIFNVAVGGYAGRNFFSGYAASAYNANIFIGMGAGDGATDGSYNIFMGLSGGYNFQSGDRNILIGNAVISTSYGAGAITQPFPTSSTNDTLGFGNLVQFTADNQIVFGSPSYPYTQVFFGEGPASTAPQTFTYSRTNASGTDVAGADTYIDVSRGTGTGIGGNIIFRYAAAAGGSGSSLNALANAWVINGNTGNLSGSVITDNSNGLIFRSGSTTPGSNNIEIDGLVQKFGDVSGASSGMVLTIDDTNKVFDVDNVTHTVAIKVNGSTGFTGGGIFTNFTFVSGICTSAS